MMWVYFIHLTTHSLYVQEDSAAASEDEETAAMAQMLNECAEMRKTELAFAAASSVSVS